MKIRKLVGCLAVVLASFNVAADEGSSGFFMNLYSAICVQSGGRPEMIRGLLDGKGAPKLTQEQAKPFLQDRKGVAWPVVVSEGTFVLVSTDDGMCSVFAKKASAKEMDEKFKSFVEGIKMGPSYKIQKMDDRSEKTGNGTTHFQSYLIGIPSEKGAFSLALTTSSSADSTVQALATMVRVSATMP